MRIHTSYITSKGKVRPKNEDTILIAGICVTEYEKIFSNKLEFNSAQFAVADGMGGHTNGDLASKTVISSIKGTVPKNFSEAKKMILSAKRELELIAQTLNLKKNIGTTLSGISFFGNECIVFHSGDSRIYRSRNGDLQKLTNDHSYVQELIDLGRISTEEARVHPDKNILKKAVMSGGDQDLEFFDLTLEKVKVGDVYLLCTDGLWETMSDEELYLILAKETNEKRIELFFERSFETGKDNISIILIDIESI